MVKRIVQFTLGFQILAFIVNLNNILFLDVKFPLVISYVMGILLLFLLIVMIYVGMGYVRLQKKFKN